MAIDFIHKLLNNEGKKKSPFEIYNNDYFLVSFPKSGNTWMRFLLGNYLTDGKTGFQNINSVIPVLSDKNELLINPEEYTIRPRIIKSHFTYKPEYPNVIYIVRDGRDVAVSLYHYWMMVKFLPQGTDFDYFLENHFYKQKWYSSWDYHLFSWMRDNKTQNILCIKYEDMVSNAFTECKKVINFMGIPLDETKLKHAIELSTFNALRKEEEKKSSHTKELAGLGENQEPTENSYFMREGKVGEWRKTFTEKQAKRFAEVYGNALVYMGYELT